MLPRDDPDPALDVLRRQASEHPLLPATARRLVEMAPVVSSMWRLPDLAWGRDARRWQREVEEALLDPKIAAGVDAATCSERARQATQRYLGRATASTTDIDALLTKVITSQTPGPAQQAGLLACHAHVSQQGWEALVDRVWGNAARENTAFAALCLQALSGAPHTALPATELRKPGWAALLGVSRGGPAPAAYLAKTLLARRVRITLAHAAAQLRDGCVAQAMRTTAWLRDADAPRDWNGGIWERWEPDAARIAWLETWQERAGANSTAAVLLRLEGPDPAGNAPSARAAFLASLDVAPPCQQTLLAAPGLEFAVPAGVGARPAVRRLWDRLQSLVEVGVKQATDGQPALIRIIDAVCRRASLDEVVLNMVEAAAVSDAAILPPLLTVAMAPSAAHSRTALRATAQLLTLLPAPQGKSHAIMQWVFACAIPAHADAACNAVTQCYDPDITQAGLRQVNAAVGAIMAQLEAWRHHAAAPGLRVHCERALRRLETGPTLQVILAEPTAKPLLDARLTEAQRAWIQHDRRAARWDDVRRAAVAASADQRAEFFEQAKGRPELIAAATQAAHETGALQWRHDLLVASRWMAPSVRLDLFTASLFWQDATASIEAHGLFPQGHAQAMACAATVWRGFGPLPAYFLYNAQVRFADDLPGLLQSIAALDAPLGRRRDLWAASFDAWLHRTASVRPAVDEAFTCSICLETCAATEHAAVAGCVSTVSACRRCTQTAMRICDSAVTVDRCPTGCGATLRREDLERFGLHAAEVAQRAARLLRQASVAGIAPCPTPDCLGICAANANVEAARCGLCERAKLEEPPDDAIIISLLQGLGGRLFSKDGNGIMRECFHCAAPTVKDGGCAQITCRNGVCGKNWHFVLGARPDHDFPIFYEAQRYRPLADGALARLGFYKDIPPGVLSDADRAALDAKRRTWLRDRPWKCKS